MKNTGLFLILIIGMLSFASCGGKSSGADPVVVTDSVAIDYNADNESSPNIVDNSEDISPYIDNSLSTGTRVYENEIKCNGSASKISVKASYNSDVVVIIKKDGRMAKNAYIEKGETYDFNVPNGYYQVFFYYGTGWNPEKEMSNGMKGGFVADEQFSKDDPVELNYQGLTYELVVQRNGNFQTKGSSEKEMFN